MEQRELEGSEDYRLIAIDCSTYVLTPRIKGHFAPDFEVTFQDNTCEPGLNGISDDLLLRILIDRMSKRSNLYTSIDVCLRNALEYLEQIDA